MNKSIPSWLAYTQAIAFVIVYAVWILPETTALRNIALIIGAFASFQVIYLYRALFLSRHSIIILLIICLFIWIILHYYFIGENKLKQLEELKSIWKYGLILGIFGLGLGITLAQDNKCYLKGFFFLGLSMPLIIFLMKIICFYLASKYNFVLPEYIQIPRSSSKYYIQKMDYIFFCIPAFIYSIINVYLIFSNQKENNIYLALYSFLVIFCTIFLFFKINTKNGMMFTLIFISIFLLFSIKKREILFKILLPLFIILPFYLNHYSNNPTWANLIPDLKIAIQTNNFQEWRDPDSAHGHIINEKNISISVSTYQRTAWFVEGVKMIPENFLGYGLIEDSFRYIAMNKWSDISKNLNHTHSGWLDIALGIGLPGVFFLLGSLILIIIRATSIINNSSKSNLIFFCFFNSLGIFFIGITNEIAAKSTIPFLVFWVTLMGILISIIESQVNKNRILFHADKS
jgi:hypothetical protein